MYERRFSRGPTPVRLDGLHPILLAVLLLAFLSGCRTSAQTSGGAALAPGPGAPDMVPYVPVLGPELSRAAAETDGDEGPYFYHGYDCGREGLLDGLAHPLQAVERSGGWGPWFGASSCP